MEQQVSAARKAGKKIAFHAGERDAGDVDAALSFDPDLLIHATHATKKQLRECAEREIPIAVCPRSNWMLGVTSSARHPPLQADAGTRLHGNARYGQRDVCPAGYVLGDGVRLNRLQARSRNHSPVRGDRIPALPAHRFLSGKVRGQPFLRWILPNLRLISAAIPLHPS